MASIYITYYLFNILDKFSHRANPPSLPQRVQEKMLGTTSSSERFLADFPTPMIPKIGGDPTKEALIKLNQFVSINTASVALNLTGVWHIHLTLTITAEEYMAHTGYAFVPPHNPGNYPPTMGTSQEQALGTEGFRKNQALSRRCNAVDGAFKIISSRRYNQSSCTHWWTS